MRLFWQSVVLCRRVNIAGDNMEEIDVELFIDEVKKRPALWDSTSDLYKNRQLKRDGWKEICEIFVSSLTEQPESKQREIGKHVFY